MIFIVDTTGDPVIVSNEDGEVMYFEDRNEALDYAEENIQAYIVLGGERSLEQQIIKDYAYELVTFNLNDIPEDEVEGCLENWAYNIGEDIGSDIKMKAIELYNKQKG